MRKRASWRAVSLWAQNVSQISLAALALMSAILQCQGQGTMMIGFEGAPYAGGPQPQPPGYRTPIGEYYESGMRFWNPYGLENLVSAGGGVSGYPDDGSAYLQVSPGARLGFTFSSGAHFNLVSLDVSGYGTSYPSVTLQVVGYGNMGLRVTNSFVLDSLASRRASQLPDFQTLSFDSRFTDLYRIDILTDRFSLDNVLLSGVPEPSSGALVLLGAACAIAFRRAVRRQRG